MPGISPSAAGYIALVTIDVDGPETQRALVDMLIRDVEDWVRHCPGFLSANYHLSTDGNRVVNYAQWADEQAYRASFDLNPGKEAMRDAIRAMPGVVRGPSMTGFILERSIAAGPATP